MTVDEAPHQAGLVDAAAAAARIVDELIAHPGGRSSPSVYETGRLVSLAPWLAGHAERVRFLLAAQRPDGGWGLPDDGYALTPTLSATDALLSVLVPTPAGQGAHPSAPGVPPEAVPGVPQAELVKAVDEALRMVSGRLLPGLGAGTPGDGAADPRGGGPVEVPDMPAIEHITPYLIELINRRLEAVRAHPPSGLESWGESGPLRAPAGMTGETASLVRELLDRGTAVPAKLLHALEIADGSARAARAVRPEPSGTVGASPAATAAWLGDDRPGDGGPGGGDAADRSAALRYLEDTVERHGGPVPVAAPITEFERGWVLSWLARAGIPLSVPSRMLDEMSASLGGAGTGGGSGLPPDADSSSGVLYALSLLGRPHPPDLLWEYETSTHMCTWQGENGHSITTNAHVLEAFGHYMQSTGRGGPRHAATVAKVANWLCEQQDADGAWRDRWHASPYYATACAAAALARFGGGAIRVPSGAPSDADGGIANGAAFAAERATRWVLETQRPDGSWGRWDGTPEETAYALHVLLLGPPLADEARPAVARGAAYLRAAMPAAEGPAAGPGPVNGLVPTPVPGAKIGLTTSFIAEANKTPLWHDKDTYHPITIVKAVTLAALHLTQVTSLR
ncbi:prenyltransferase/squalene oxidase repeat-containing protein [Actinomadura sp. 9N407]|uniref:prenyltransferase/squalene oxidase repeat-containing protein n=1 Tax=Actinomadura sp. 9N407 TaxID=3375154 RepID=UPI00378FCD53